MPAGCYMDGVWVPTAATFEVTDPATRNVVGALPLTADRNWLRRRSGLLMVPLMSGPTALRRTGQRSCGASLPNC